MSKRHIDPDPQDTSGEDKAAGKAEARARRLEFGAVLCRHQYPPRSLTEQEVVQTGRRTATPGAR